MAHRLQVHFHLIFVLCTLLISSPSIHNNLRIVQASSPPIQALVAPITKDTATSLYTLSLSQRQYLLDLSGPLLWSPCSTPHPTVPCSSGDCAAAASGSGAPKSCTGQRPCTVRPTNPVTGEQAAGNLTFTDISTNATDGKTPTAVVTVHGVLSSCAPVSLLRSFPGAAAGDAGLGRGSAASLAAQLYAKLSLKRQLAICLPSVTDAPGVAFFGSGPYGFLPFALLDASDLAYTNLVKNSPSSSSSAAYGIRLSGIAVNQEAVPLAAGVTVTFDTALPYTVLRRDVYRVFVDAYQSAMAGVPRVPGVAPFEACFNSSGLGVTRVGYAVPSVDLMTEGGGGNWTVWGSNLVTQVATDVACLAFVDGGWAAPSAVALGRFQMEDNLLVFDEANSRLGFTGTLLFIRTTCSNFNFTRG
nr:unnamed protein product [Digitaria exilis]